MPGLLSILFLFRNEFNKFNNTRLTNCVYNFWIICLQKEGGGRNHYQYLFSVVLPVSLSGGFRCFEGLCKLILVLFFSGRSKDGTANWVQKNLHASTVRNSFPQNIVVLSILETGTPRGQPMELFVRCVTGDLAQDPL